MDTKVKLLRRGLLLIGLLALVAGAVFAAPHIGRAIGQFIAPKSLRTLNGEAVSSIEAYLADHPAGPGRMAYMLYFRTDCAACAKQLPEFYALDTMGGDLLLVAVNLGETEQAVKAHLDHAGIVPHAAFPVLLGATSLPDNGEAIPTISIYIPDPETGEWTALGHSEGLQTTAELQGFAYRMLIGALGGAQFWDGNLVVSGWYEYNGHHTAVAIYSGDYEPTQVEVAAWLGVMVDMAGLEPEHGLYIHVLVPHETYGLYTAFSLVATAESLEGYSVPDDEAEAEAMIAAHFIAIDAQYYFWLDGQVPLFSLERAEEQAWHYSYYAAILLEQDWREDFPPPEGIE